MYTISNNIKHEIIINKSRFIALLYKVKSEEEVKIYLNKIKTEYKDATHYCFSYIIDNTKRFNDDGEPGGTAGMPILNVLENNNLNYVLCVVVRYFGGIKLGAGGLVRAYSKSASEALNKIKLNKLEIGKIITIKFNYDKQKLIDNLLKEIIITEKEFNDIITYKFYITNNEYENIKEGLINNSVNIETIDNEIIEKAI